MSDDLREPFGKVMRKRREWMQLSQGDFAHRNHVDRTFVGQVERGECAPSLTMMFKIAGGLGLTASALLRQAEDLARREGYERR